MEGTGAEGRGVPICDSCAESVQVMLEVTELDLARVEGVDVVASAKVSGTLRLSECKTGDTRLMEDIAIAGKLKMLRDQEVGNI